jgi:hypothetical protein
MFGSWNAALAAAGIDSKSSQAETLISNLGDLGENTNQRETPETGVGIDVHRRGRQWSEREILQAVIQRSQSKKPVNATAVLADQGALYRAATKLYGSWKNTLVAAGLPTKVPRKA